METAEIALLISLGSLVVAATSLGWNIYRDVIRKPRLRVSIKVGQVIHPSFTENLQRVIVSITNFGPGKTKASMLVLRKTSLWRKLFQKQIYGILVHDFEDPLSGKLPAELNVGDKVDLTFRYLPNIFLEKNDNNQVGINDPFGNTYWCRKKDYKRALKDYGNTKTRNSSLSS